MFQKFLKHKSNSPSLIDWDSYSGGLAKEEKSPKEYSEGIKLDKSILKSLKRDLKQAKSVIDKMKLEKKALQDALKDTLDKKQELFAKAKEYYNLLMSEIEKNKELEKRIAETEKINLALEETQKELISKDEMILDLMKENKYIEKPRKKSSYIFDENLLSPHNYIDNEYYKSQISSDLLYAGEKMMGKLYSSREIYRIFKKSVTCSHYFNELLNRQEWDDALLKLLNFINELLDHIDEVPNDKSIQTFHYDSVHEKILKNKEEQFSEINESVEEGSLMEDLNIQKNKLKQLNNQISDNLAKTMEKYKNLDNKSSESSLIAPRVKHSKTNSEQISYVNAEEKSYCDTRNQADKTSFEISPKRVTINYPKLKLRQKSEDALKKQRYMGLSPTNKVMPILRKSDCWDSAGDFFGSRLNK
ncbi:unnamed protein product [Blepharisma stoltei]|uniref:Uncharacterized protein n=1 Tax=Blepharisma stoltei TaxID=1481888 RepID=A0AAU9KB10_9CILI|nr:unnamed protein product [Blepharisma stoltei]